MRRFFFMLFIFILGMEINTQAQGNEYTPLALEVPVYLTPTDFYQPLNGQKTIKSDGGGRTIQFLQSHSSATFRKMSLMVDENSDGVSIGFDKAYINGAWRRGDYYVSLNYYSKFDQRNHVIPLTQHQYEDFLEGEKISIEYIY